MSHIMPNEMSMPIYGGKWVIDLNTGTNSNDSTPEMRIDLLMSGWVSDSDSPTRLSLSFSSSKGSSFTQRDAMSTGITTDTMQGTIK